MANNQNLKPLIYAFVSRGTVIHAEFTEFSDESTGRQLPIAFPERVKDDFASKYGGVKGFYSSSQQP